MSHDPSHPFLEERGPDFAAPEATETQADQQLDEIEAQTATEDEPASETELPTESETEADSHRELTYERPHPLTPLLRGWIVIVALGAVLLQDMIRGDFERDMFPFMAAIFGVFALVQIVVGFFVWRTTRFVVTEKYVLIERKFIYNSVRRLSLQKIQSISSSQPLLARPFGLTQLHLNAGAGENLTLAFLPKSRAEDLRKYLIQTTKSAKPDADTDSEQPPAESVSPDEMIAKASPRNLVLGAITSNSFISVVIYAVLYERLVSWMQIPEARVGLLALLWPVVSIFNSRVVQQWNYTLSRNQDSLTITRGLTNLASQAVPRQRIQGILIRQSLIGRFLKLWEMEVTILGHNAATADAETTTLVLPFSPRRDVKAALAAIWPGLNLDEIVRFHISERAKWLHPIGWSQIKFGVNEHVVVSESGVFTHHVNIVPHARMQALSLQNGPLARALGLAWVHMHISSGPVACGVGELDRDIADRFATEQIIRARYARAHDLEMNHLMKPTPQVH